MKKFSTLMAGVIFPGSESYLEAYAHSLNAQTDKEFDLLIINDGADPALRRFFPDSTTWITITDKKTPAEIRQLLVTTAIDNDYEHLIFSDVDDYFSNNRVSESKRFLRDYEFVFNELVLVDQSGSVLEDAYLTSMGIPTEINNYLAIQDKNFIGLGHSAIKLRQANFIFIPETIIAVDWWIYSLLLLRGSRGKFIPNASTYYRQHAGNFIGIRKRLTKESLALGIRVKKSHFAALTEYAELQGLSEIAQSSRQRCREIEQLSDRISENAFCEHYIDSINRNTDLFTGWWSEIVPATVFDCGRSHT